MKDIVFIIGARSNQAEIYTKTMIGQSLKFFNYPFSSADIYYENRKGLSEIYNDAINKYLCSGPVKGIHKQAIIWFTSVSGRASRWVI